MLSESAVLASIGTEKSSESARIDGTNTVSMAVMAVMAVMVAVMALVEGRCVKQSYPEGNRRSHWSVSFIEPWSVSLTVMILGDSAAYRIGLSSRFSTNSQ